MRKNLKMARKRKRLKGYQIAPLLYVSLRTYWYIEAGKTDSYPDVWDKLEKILGVPKEILKENY